MALNCIHDPINGSDIRNDQTIENHINDLISRSGSPIPEFICFSCPEFGTDLDTFSAHSLSAQHLEAVKGSFQSVLNSCGAIVKLASKVNQSIESSDPDCG